MPDAETDLTAWRYNALQGSILMVAASLHLQGEDAARETLAVMIEQNGDPERDSDRLARMRAWVKKNG